MTYASIASIFPVISGFMLIHSSGKQAHQRENGQLKLTKQEESNMTNTMGKMFSRKVVCSPYKTGAREDVQAKTKITLNKTMTYQTWNILNLSSPASLV